MKSASLQYANALADITLEQGAADPALSQLMELTGAYSESAELRNFLESPAISKEAKHGVVEKLAARIGASKIVRNFLFVVIDHGRTALLPEITKSFQEVVRQRQGVAEAEIVSAMELSASQKKQLLQTLERKTGKKIQAKYSLEPGLLGGARVRIGDTVYDGSVRTQLDHMREQLAAE
ncbi:MAG TPA: ATP synthase F1 subunit delta [Candidatus Acidoferrum sp.]